MNSSDRAALIARLREHGAGLCEEAANMLEADAQQEPINIRNRWNIEQDGDDLLICENNHDKGEKCEYVRYVRADSVAVPQEPVAWQYRGRPAVNHEWGEWHTVGYKPKGPECTRFMMRPLFAAPQPQPRLTDAEILTLWAQTYVERGTSGIEFARSIERKVRGEA